ncbi:leucyl/phenylalanyl-tRNA--protein transferase [Kitasatospora sp. MAP12-15]|uniref:leucyl/phenylalanyl-tRNA--protein transferase n=1 Tax=unclassified Kitasatospora TaxID=2633591 RepID=UPI002475FC00|nr:leucyl/phenylalanyl-tRNA--protein transferase [Kitasatospora sp. MAP12-44]MDH6114954.1 leucyl/phenylalanyl-tRNA--protein transferase [Kitasatospora sp. MAP12-44]
MTRRCASWAALDLRRAPAGGPVAFCGDLGPANLLAAYRAGLFPFPAAGPLLRDLNEARYEQQVADGLIALVGDDARDPYAVSWWCPDPRPVLAVEGVRPGRSLAKQLRNRTPWSTSLNRAFGQVVEECRTDREPQWLTEELADSMASLHASGWALSAEVWEGETLVGGVFGLRAGPVLSLDSMFHRRSNAGKVALADLADRFARVGGALLDTQWDSPQTRAIGAAPLPRSRYLDLLRGAPAPPSPPDHPLPARRLA